MQITNTGLKIPKELQESSPVVNESQQLGKDDFMKLLVAEMTNQDPLDPKTNTESIAQMAQFSALEQGENLNKSFNSMLRFQTLNTLSSSAQMIGKYTRAKIDGEEVVGQIKSTHLENGQVFANVIDSENQEIKIPLETIVALSKEKFEEKGKTDSKKESLPKNVIDLS
ncbi:flagellar basal-body rod modification protein FlgD [Hypnocyclicus thermotrophus]|uniref:Flagellar basal-body rod modification protein FlgD n=1 Tax=Hypnocyclicus thermotrophus TaxID=1627895 RepID=A0AA46DXR6_9FUSO|nr:flagellar hook capping FlgD N-terminal domain-containing protein [Hypnocyclicus thermotrophus]TDT68548.1 flagellar basal-body rod modification protein FlgD [Hypnocyclicus thermotrophus]